MTRGTQQHADPAARRPFQPRSQEDKDAAFKAAADEMQAWADERRKANATEIPDEDMLTMERATAGGAMLRRAVAAYLEARKGA